MDGGSVRHTIVATDRKDRLDWIDLARGICIILVVMMHFDEIYFSHLQIPDAAKRVSDTISSLARPARMPTFFLISGFLASRSLHKPWGEVFAKRVGLLYWVYLLWSIISIATLYALFEPATAENAQRFLARVASEALYPTSPTWFLYGLVIFFLAARFLAKWPVATVTITFALSAFAEQIPDLVTSQILRSAPYFFVGIFFPKVMTRLAEHASIKALAGLAVVYVLALAPLLLFDRDIVGIWLPATVVGIMLVIVASRLMGDAEMMAPFRYVGRNTLPIYVMHVSLLLVMRVYSQEWLSLGLVPALIFSVVGNVLLICVCLALFHGLRKLRLGWLFALPKFLAARLGGRVS